MKELTIGAVADMIGVRTSTLRYYEAVGLLPQPQRENGRRRYGPDILQRLAVIQAAQNVGFTLAEIQTLLDGFDPGATASDRWRVMAPGKIAALDQQIAQAQRMKQTLEQALRCECLRFEDCPLVTGQ